MSKKLWEYTYFFNKIVVKRLMNITATKYSNEINESNPIKIKNAEALFPNLLSI